MSLKQVAIQALDALTVGSTSPQFVNVRDGGHHLECRFITVDALACAFDQFAVTADSLAGSSVDDLKKVGEALSTRLNYLLEPISPIEIDSEGCHVQLRSNPPQRDDDGTKYYELVVSHDGVMSLVRYSKSSGSPRQTIPAEVTREVWGRLVEDFSAVAP